MKFKLQDKLLKTMFVMIPLTLLTLGVSYSVHKAADYLYNTYTAPFLQNGVIVTHSQSKLTTQPLHIEYSVLKVLTGNKTAAKK